MPVSQHPSWTRDIWCRVLCILRASEIVHLDLEGQFHIDLVCYQGSIQAGALTGNLEGMPLQSSIRVAGSGLVFLSGLSHSFRVV